MTTTELFRLSLTRDAAEPAGPELVSVGIPFPRGLICQPGQIELADPRGSRMAASLVATAHWPDLSVKWLSAEFLFDMGALAASELLVRRVPAPAQGAATEVRLTEREIVVTRKGYCATLDRRWYAPFTSIRSEQGGALLDGSELAIRLAHGERRRFAVRKSEVTSDELATRVRFAGRLSGRGKGGELEFHSLVALYDGLIRVELSVTNPRAAKHRGGVWDLGDPNSLHLEDLSQSLRFAPLRKVRYSCGSGFRSAPSVLIYQGGSGGINSGHVNHVDRSGQVKAAGGGFEVRCRQEVLESGLRSEPELIAEGDGFSVALSLADFWQNFPKALGLEAGLARLALFPGECRAGFELQPGEQKTHRYYIRIAGADARLGWVHRGVSARVPLSWYLHSRAVPYLDEASRFDDPLLDPVARSLVQGDNTLFARREAIDEYGWRNFGDVFADHECLEVPKGGEQDFVSHYNNQYDHLYSFLFQYFKSGDRSWLEVGSDLARHVMDIDLYHTDRDRSCYNHGLFWHTDHYVTAATATHRSFSIHTMQQKGLSSYGGGPGYDHVYTRGLKYYYFLTGDQMAKQSALELADWAVRGIDGTATFCEKLEEGVRAGLRRRRGGEGMRPYVFDGPGRSSGNALNVLVDAFELTGDPHYLRKAELLITRCLAPDDDIEARSLLEPNLRWMYTIFLLALESYLALKRQYSERDDMYWYAAQALGRYAVWMSRNELPFLERKEQLDYPNYATRSAQDLRKCAVLLVAMKYCNSQEAEALYDRACSIYGKAADYLAGTRSRFLMRPAAVIMALEGPLKLRCADHPLSAAAAELPPGTLRPVPVRTGALATLGSLLRYTSVTKEWAVLTGRIEEVLGQIRSKRSARCR